MLNKKQYILAWFVSLLIIVTIIDVTLYWFELTEPEYLIYSWNFVFYILLIMWIEQDARERKNIYQPFEYGFLVYVFGLIYIPYYFIKTRKWIGVLCLIGLIILFYIGYLLKLAIYYAGI